MHRHKLRQTCSEELEMRVRFSTKFEEIVPKSITLLLTSSQRWILWLRSLLRLSWKISLASSLMVCGWPVMLSTAVCWLWADDRRSAVSTVVGREASMTCVCYYVWLVADAREARRAKRSSSSNNNKQQQQQTTAGSSNNKQQQQQQQLRVTYVVRGGYPSGLPGEGSSA